MIDTTFTPFPEIITERLVLRQLKKSDAQDIFAHRLNEGVNTYVDNFRHPSIDFTLAFIERIEKETAEKKTILWAVTLKGENKFLGTICLWNISTIERKAEAGYSLDPKVQKKGLMNEALIKIIDFGFQTMKLKTIEAYTHKDNEGSIRLLLKNNFRQDTTRIPVKEKGENRIIFTLLNEHINRQYIRLA